MQTREARGKAEDLESIPGPATHLLGFLKRRLIPSLCTIYPSEQAGWPKCSLKPAQLEGSANLSPSAWLAFAIQTHQPGAQGARVPHFLLSSPIALALWVSSPLPGAQGSPLRDQDCAAAFAGVLRLLLSPDQSFSTVWGLVGGEGDPSASCPNLDSASIFPFLHGGQREKKEREAFEKRLLLHRSAIHLAAEPSDTPVVHLLATRQLFSLL